MRSVEAVCFDLDSTLCIRNQSDEAIHQAVFRRAGIEPLFSPADLRAVNSTAVASAESDAEFYANLYRAAIRTHTSDLDPTVLSELGQITTEVIDESDVSFRNGANEALEYVRERYRVGLITNGAETTQRQKLQTLGIPDAFDVTVFGHPANGVAPKPASEPFEIALRRLEAQPESTVYIGDNYHADVVGAHDVGIQSVWVPRGRSHHTPSENPNPAPTHRLDSLSQLLEIL